MPKLGTMERITDLRTVWKHEAQDFSKWLATEDNLALLAEAVDLNEIVCAETESAVGGYSADIFAREDGTDRRIIIENQLENTNHDHLGKIITYAAGKDAEIIIWIVKKARDEHIQAVEWLNQHTDERIGFFLLEIELWRIGDSLPAPKFNVIERPNEWAKCLKSNNLTDLRQLQLEFWQAFINHAFTSDYKDGEINRRFSQRTPKASKWFTFRAGTTQYTIEFAVGKTIQLYILTTGDRPLYDKMKADKEKIELDIGFALEWCEDAEKRRKIAISRDGGLESRDKWGEFFDWYCEMALTLDKVAKEYLKR